MATPGIIYDLGGKFDQSWNQGLFESAMAWEGSSGESFRELELQSEAQRTQALYRFADAGYSPIFLQNTLNLDIASTFEAISSYPSVDFVFFSELEGGSGSLSTAGNAYIIVFDSLELARVAGYAAALTSQTGTVGFIGGMEDTLSGWAAAFAEGARSARPDINVLTDFIGNSPAAWYDPVRATELANEQAQAGADLFFSPAGASSLGVYDFALNSGLMTIGYDRTISDTDESSHVFTIGPDFSSVVSDVMDSVLSYGENLMGFAEGYLQIAEKGFDSNLFTADIQALVATFIDTLEDPVPPVEAPGEFLEGSEESDDLAGGAGDDTVIGGAGSDEINGGPGADLLLGGEVEDVSDATGARIFRVFQATLDRAPDSTGYNNWSGQLASGETNLLEVIEGFVNSAEFQETYGALGNAAFVNLLYQNVLGREADATGLNTWVAQLETGTSRAVVVRGFSESAEFKTNTNDAASAYVAAEAAPFADDVYRLFQATLDRAPDLTGLENWSGRLGEGMDYTDVAAGFVNSAEFQNVYGALNNAAFVTLLYNNVLGRDPDAGGLANWNTQLAEGMSREEVVRGFAQSGEFTANTAQPFHDFMAAQEGDTIRGGAGNDLIHGGLLADTFQFDAADKGSDRVLQLDAWDSLEFTGFGYGSAAAVASHLTETANDVIFADQGVRVIFMNTDLATMEDVSIMV